MLNLGRSIHPKYEPHHFDGWSSEMRTRKKQAELKHSCDGDTMKVAISSSLHEYSSPGTVSQRNVPPLSVN